MGVLVVSRGVGLVARETIRVMVTVKAYPTLSKKYDETVCVAGIRIDTARPEHVRLFPVPFRDLEKAKQFRKYDVIEVEVESHDPRKDNRPESLRPRLDTLKVVGHISSARGWAERAAYVRPLVAPSLCEIKREQARNGTSLGVFRPGEVLDFTLEPAPERPEAVEMMANQMHLFDPERKKLEHLPYRFMYHFRCAEAGCPSHRIGLVDWEAGVSYLDWRRRYPPEELPAKLKQKWFHEIAGPGRDVHFFVGNLHKRPQQFMLLGVFYPPVGVMGQDTLF